MAVTFKAFCRRKMHRGDEDQSLVPASCAPGGFPAHLPGWPSSAPFPWRCRKTGAHNLGLLTSVQMNPTGVNTPRFGSWQLASKQVRLASLDWQGFGTASRLFERDLSGSWLCCHLSMEVLFISKDSYSGLMNNWPSWPGRKVVQMLLLFPAKKCHSP